MEGKSEELVYTHYYYGDDVCVLFQYQGENTLSLLSLPLSLLSLSSPAFFASMTERPFDAEGYSLRGLQTYVMSRDTAKRLK